MGATLFDNAPMIGSGGLSGNWDDDIAYYLLREKYPNLDQDASLAGWRPDGRGNYVRTYNGVNQTIPAAMLASQLGEQVKATQLSEPVGIGGGRDYLSQIQQYLGGSSTVPTQYDNPYEQRLIELMNSPDSIADTNAYKFRFNQGQQALERSAAARGMLNSGNTLAALADYGQGAASQEYGNEFNRLASLVGQRNQFNLGRAGLDQSDRQGRAGTALRALMGYDDSSINARNSAASNSANLGRINAGERSRTSTW